MKGTFKFFAIALIIMLSSSSSNAAQCTGNPPKYNGLPCATTTRYWDGQMGACGCGTGNQSPFSWQWDSKTAAASQAIFDPSGSSWCGAGCGSCFELTPTGDCTTNDNCAATMSPVTVMVTNLCPYAGNEQWCPNPGSQNTWGYQQHFDLMDNQMSGWVSSMGWNNPIVTYRQVPCGGGGSPSCSQAAQCVCSTGGQCNRGDTTPSPTTPSIPEASPTPPPSIPETPSVPSIPDTPSTPSAPSSPSSSDASCAVTVTQSVANSWEGGGLVNVLVTNTGSHPITRLSINMDGNGLSVWNMEKVSPSEWSLPEWAFPIQPGTTYTSTGYTFTSNQPSMYVALVAC